MQSDNTRLLGDISKLQTKRLEVCDGVKLGRNLRVIVVVWLVAFDIFCCSCVSFHRVVQPFEPRYIFCFSLGLSVTIFIVFIPVLNRPCKSSKPLNWPTPMPLLRLWTKPRRKLCVKRYSAVQTKTNLIQSQLWSFVSLTDCGLVLCVFILLLRLGQRTDEAAEGSGQETGQGQGQEVRRCGDEVAHG